MTSRPNPVRLASVVAVLVLAAVAAGCGRFDELPEHESLCDLGRANEQGVAGHDLAVSTRLADGRVLFAFGDTYLGRVDGDRRSTVGLLNSTGAVLPAGADICSPELRYLTDDDGAVRPLLAPPTRKGTVFWPVDVAAVGERVYLLYDWIEPSGDGALQVRVRGTGLAVADDDDLVFERLDGWVTRDPDLSVPTLAADGERLLTLACTRPDGGCRGATIVPSDGRLVVDGAAVGFGAAEMALAPVDVDGEQRWRLSGMSGLSCRLEVAEATSPLEHWDDEETVRRPKVPHRTLCYAGRVQEPFSTADELVVTWVDNARERVDGDAYWPHVERIDLSDG